MSSRTGASAGAHHADDELVGAVHPLAEELGLDRARHGATIVEGRLVGTLQVAAGRLVVDGSLQGVVIDQDGARQLPTAGRIELLDQQALAGIELLLARIHARQLTCTVALVGVDGPGDLVEGRLVVAGRLIHRGPVQLLG